MGRKENLLVAKHSATAAIKALAGIKDFDIKNRKSVKRSLKAKYTTDINKISAAIASLVDAKQTIRVIPKSVQ